MSLTHPRLIGLAIAALVFLADQAMKWLVTAKLGVDSLGESLELLPVFNFTYAENTGVSLNLFAAESAFGRWALVALTGAVAIGVLVWMLRESRMRDIAALALVLGGALGNILDRVRFGHVVDYADLHLEQYLPFLKFDLLGRPFDLTRPFLIFNVADAAITIGILIILARSFLSREKGDNKSATAPETR